MNFLLKNLEHALSDQHLLVGEKLLEDGKVTQLFENEHHLWIAKVDGFEVEVQISPSRVKACSCECETFEREKFCGHVAAGLLLLRRKLSETVREPRQNAQKNKPLAYQKLTVNAILDSVTQDELAAFVRNFARTNKQFSLALRAKFAVKVPLFDNQEKFGQLLDASIQTYRKANDRISIAGVKQLEKLLEELLGQADDALALEHFAEGWAMLSAIVGRFSPIIKKVDGEEELLKEKLRQAFTKLKELVALPIPPDLQAEIRAFCEAEFNRPAYRINGFSGPLLQVWLDLASDPEQWQQLLDALDADLAKPRADASYRAQLVMVKLAVLERPGMSAAAQAFTLDCLSDANKLLHVVDAVEETTGNFLPIKSLVEKGLRLLPDETVKARLEGILLQIAQTEGKADVIASISRQKFLETRDFAFYDQCKLHYKKGWEAFVKKLLADLVQRYDFRQNFPTIATILGREGKLVELLGLLEEQQSLEMLAAFDHFLLKTKPKETLQLYEKLLKSYLADHLGLKASKQVRAVLEHLHKMDAGGMANRLLSSIHAAFPQRKFYLEEDEIVGLL